MTDWIGDQMAGVGPEATRVFGRNAQIAAIPRRRCERVKSTLNRSVSSLAWASLFWPDRFRQVNARLKSILCYSA